MLRPARIVDRITLSVGAMLLALIALAMPAVAGVTLTGASPSSFSGPGETITFQYRLDNENIVVNSMTLSGGNKPVSGLTCTPDFPLPVFGTTNCTATYSTTAGDTSDIMQFAQTYDLTTIGGPRSGTVTGTVTVVYDPPGPPVLTINDVAISEGGLAAFTVSLDSPADSGGVTFDIATADGSAGIGDYVPRSLTGQTIPAGSSSYSFSVQTSSDATAEVDETFFVNVTNVTGATVADSQGMATILNDDVLPTVTGATPDIGPPTGGTSVTIAGTSFTGATGVSFGGVPASSFTVNSTTQITAVTPAGTAGAVDVTVTTPVGSATLAGGFTYEAPPAVTSVNVPANGYYRTGDVLSFTVNFDKSVVVDTSGGTPTVPLTIGATTTNASYVAGSGTNALAFQYTVNAGDQDLDGIQVGAAIDADGGAIASAVGTPAELALNNVASTSGVFVYTAEPSVLSTQVTGSPPSNATTVTFEIVFSEAVTGLALSDLSLAAAGTAAATLADLQTPDNITYTVAANGIAGTGTLRLDVAANAAVNIAGAGNPAYSGGTEWVVAPSADATLADLVPSVGTLVPAFDPATTAYDIAVDNATDSITLTPSAAEANATITVDGQTVASGSASQAIALSVGSTAIPVVVTAEDGAATQTYTVTVTRAPSADAALADLVPSVGTLDPAFDPATTAYDIAVDNATDSITLTPSAAEPNATITVAGQTVASGSASQLIALTVGSTAITVVVAAENGTATQTYTVTVTRAASADAALADLVPSAGTLDPAFDADSLDYGMAVANAVDSLTLTPTGNDANATITVNGQAVTSGSASQAIALPVGSTTIPVVVTAQDGMTTRTYTVTVERAQPVPTVISRAIEIDAGDTASVDLAEGATGGPFTDAAIVDLSDADAGTARIEHEGQTYRLIFVSSSTYAGEADVRFTLSNAAGTSAPGTITFTIVGRPDPSQDPEVVGLLTAQVDAAKRFAQVQTRNFNDRLEQLHDEGDRRSNSMNLRLGYNEEEKPGDREIRQLVERTHEVPGLLGYAPQGVGGSESGAFGSNDAAASKMSAGDGGIDLGPYAVWTGGYINFGESDDGGLDLDHTMVGISAGIDYRFSKKFVAGFGVGFGRDRTDVGTNGTQSTGRAYSAAVYGSYKPFDNFFLDGLVGGSWLDFDSRRYVTATGDFANGSRSGRQIFGSLTAAYEFRDQTWLVSPYGRVEMSRTWLDGFIEEGGGDFGLRYGDQSIDTVSGVIGLRAEYAFKTGWGTLTPGARVEYTHDFAGSSRVNLGYIDLDHLPYWLDIEASSRSYVTLGLSLDAELPEAWTLGFDYRTAFGSDQQDHAFGLQLAKRF